MLRITTTAGQTAREIRLFAKQFDTKDRRSRFNQLVVSRSTKDVKAKIQATFRSGGDGQWAPLTPWTRDRTGRSKPLRNMVRNFRTEVKPGRGKVFFDSPSREWDATMHHKGFKVGRTSNTFMAWQNNVGGVRVLFNRKSFSVPARKIWPSNREVRKIVDANINTLKGVIEARFR